MATTTQHGPIVMRFQTLGGATVIVTKETPRRDAPDLDHRWVCEGCPSGTYETDRLTESRARDLANEHAGQCRAMPR
jgi:hypothetical protein